MNNITPLNGLVLAGGKSRRMGQDKGLIEYHGRPQREVVFRLLQQYCNSVYTSCKYAHNIPFSLNPLEDRFEIESPLNGILTAFDLNNTAWLTIPVDMPLVNKESIDILLTHRKIDKLATCFYDSSGNHPEPLLTIWEAHAYPALRAFYQNGNYSPRKFLEEREDINIIKAPNASIHLNINTPEALQKYLNR